MLMLIGVLLLVIAAIIFVYAVVIEYIFKRTGALKESKEKIFLFLFAGGLILGWYFLFLVL